MSQNEFLKYEASGIAGLLRTKTLSVPAYQRSYSWTTPAAHEVLDGAADKRQVSEFWTDLLSSFKSKQSYFLGTVVLAGGEEEDFGRKRVIDGQQRLATASLLMAAIRDRYIHGGESRDGASTQQEFLGRYDKRARADLPKLILNTEDRDFYQRHVINSAPLDPANISQRLISDAYRYLQEKVNEFADLAGLHWAISLSELETWLDESVQVVAIEVASEADAFMIFETLNDRGADLTVADLLKNYLFSQSGARLDEVQANWSATLANLGIEKVGNQVFTAFARHLLSSKLGLVREREVYSKLKSTVNGPDSAVNFTLELKEASRLYYAIIRSDSDYWSEYPNVVGDAADVVAELKIERYRALVLAALATFGKKEIQRFIPALVSWSVRMLAVGNLSGGVAESAFCEAAVAIRSGAVTTTEQILSQTKVGALIPSDAVFKKGFSEWRVVPRLSRYLLRSLELTTRGEREPELVVNDDVDLVNLEHVLPRNAKDGDWPSFSLEDRRSYVDRLGNHVLLKKGVNDRIGNKGWEAKRPVLAASALQTTSQVAEQSDWLASSIVERQAKLAELAVATWPRLPRL